MCKYSLELVQGFQDSSISIDFFITNPAFLKEWTSNGVKEWRGVIKLENINIFRVKKKPPLWSVCLHYSINESKTKKKVLNTEISPKIKHLHLIRREEESPSQDCVPVLYSSWNSVSVAKVCVGILVTVCIVSNIDVIPSTKYWTRIWTLVNCIRWVRHHALEWSKTFFVSERKYERLGTRTIAVTCI